MNIKNIRQKALLTQKEFAEELCVSLSTISKWENNERNPSIKQQRKIIDFCKRKGIEL